jgi:integrase
MGELLALRWLDVDWQAQRIRVRRSYVRGHLGTPKSRRGSRSVPLADRLGGELGPALSRDRPSGRRGSRVRQPTHRDAPRRGCGAACVPAGPEARRRSARPLPRSATHVRDADGRCRRAAAHTAGVDGAP